MLSSNDFINREVWSAEDKVAGSNIGFVSSERERERERERETK